MQGESVHVVLCAGRQTRRARGVSRGSVGEGNNPEERVKKLIADSQMSLRQSASANKKCRKVKVESAGLRGKLQSVQLRVADLESHSAQRVVVDPSAESRTVAF